MEGETAVIVLHVHAVQREQVGVHVQAQGTVEALYKGDSAGMRLCHRGQAQDAFGAAPIAPHELVGDGLHDLGAQRAVVAEQVAQLERQRGSIRARLRDFMRMIKMMATGERPLPASSDGTRLACCPRGKRLHAAALAG